MNISSKLKILTIATVFAIACGQADARRPHRHHICHPARVVMVSKPVHHHAVDRRVCNRFDRDDRLAMALAYLTNNPRLTIKQYAKMTSLTAEAAEAELDTFVLDRRIPIRSIFEGKKKLYVFAGAIS